MDFEKELAKWGYNKGNSIDVETLVSEILPYLLYKQEIMYEEDMREAFKNGAFKWRMHSGGKCFEEWFEQFKKQ